VQRDRIAGFLSARPSTANALALVTFDIAGTELQLAAWALAELPEKPAELVELVTEAAQDHADDHGRGKYSLLWCVGDGKTARVVKRKAFLFEPREDSSARDTQREAGQAFDTTAPSVALIFAQVVRHAENMHKLYVQSLGSVVVAQRDVITELANQNGELLRRVRNLTGRTLDAEGRQPAEAEGVESLARAAAIEKVGDFFVQHLGPIIAEKVATATGANGRPA
jgi:hypothetical protein